MIGLGVNPEARKSAVIRVPIATKTHVLSPCAALLVRRGTLHGMDVSCIEGRYFSYPHLSNAFAVDYSIGGKPRQLPICALLAFAIRDVEEWCDTMD